MCIAVSVALDFADGIAGDDFRAVRGEHKLNRRGEITSVGEVVEHCVGVAELFALTRDGLGDCLARLGVVKCERGDAVAGACLAKERAVWRVAHDMVGVHRIGFDEELVAPSQLFCVELLAVVSDAGAASDGAHGGRFEERHAETVAGKSI